MKRILKRIPLYIFLVALLAAVVSLVVWYSEVKSLLSLKLIDKHPLYTMAYEGDYGFDDFLKQGAKSDGDIEKFVTKRLTKGLPFNFHVTDGGCSAFTARNEKNEPLYARNFDFTFTPAILLKTKPANGYASISMVNLSYAGYGKNNLPQPQRPNSYLTLAAPFLPFDGMNEKGLTVALLAVSKAQTPKNPKAVTLNTTTTIRLLLDKAATVEQAEDLLKKYNIYFSGNVQCHFLIADASGKSILAEYWGNQVQFVKSPEKYQVATNFIEYNGLNIGETSSKNYAMNEFHRYDIIHAGLTKNKGVLKQSAALNLLKSASQKTTQWSIVYNQKTLSGTVCIGGNYSNSYPFTLK